MNEQKEETEKEFDAIVEFANWQILCLNIQKAIARRSYNEARHILADLEHYLTYGKQYIKELEENQKNKLDGEQ